MRCTWCGGPGEVRPGWQEFDNERVFEDPVLCDVCAGLIGWGGGGGVRVDERYYWAQEQVHAELSREWHREMNEAQK